MHSLYANQAAAHGWLFLRGTRPRLVNLVVQEPRCFLCQHFHTYVQAHLAGSLLNCRLALRTWQSMNISSLLGVFALIWISSDMLTLTPGGWLKKKYLHWTNERGPVTVNVRKQSKVLFSITKISNMGPDAMFKYHGNPLFLVDLLCVWMGGWVNKTQTHPWFRTVELFLTLIDYVI